MLSGEKLFQVGQSLFTIGAGLFAGYQAWRARSHAKKSAQASTETKEMAQAAKEVAQAAGQEIHETKLVAETTKQAINSTDVEGLKRMLELHMSSNDARLLSYRSLLDEYTLKLSRFEKDTNERSTVLQDISGRLTGIEVSIAKLDGLFEKLEHSSSRHSEQINMLLKAMLDQRNGGTVSP